MSAAADREPSLWAQLLFPPQPALGSGLLKGVVWNQQNKLNVRPEPSVKSGPSGGERLGPRDPAGSSPPKPLATCCQGTALVLVLQGTAATVGSRETEKTMRSIFSTGSK
ncbi:collagen alpha-1(VIII) chain isoform X2 [Rhinatrema bivittatum]|uniref:collagen alpha-1(VIII) chain isoform X2 n=1 Tax=Rhinatrema bivittatum TaxID=194408 RepID=UPI001129BEAA|nr:collagen alpha-1(VIII) chain isoform X2 [Rhinatrema bivittatum]